MRVIRSANALEYVYLLRKESPSNSYSEHLASLHTTILYMQYPLPRFEHSVALRQAWQLLKQHKSLYRYPLIISLLSVGTLGYSFFFDPSPSVATYLPLVIGGVNVWMTYRFMMQVVKLFAGDSYPIRSRKQQLKHFVGFILLSLLFALATLVGLLLFFVPGLYFLNRCLLAPAFYLDDKVGVFASFRESWKRTERHFYMLLPAMGILLLLTLGISALGVATFILLPLEGLYLFILYRYMQEIPQDVLPAC